jgi:hypothetical protein
MIVGVCYNISNETKKEWINPGKVGGGAMKRYGMVLNCGLLLADLMSRRWKDDNVKINDDLGDHYEEVKEGYKDVTVEAVGSFNEVFEGDMKIETCAQEDD